jgi:adenylate cyclase
MPAPDLQQIRFGEFDLDLDRGTLQRAGADIGLRPQAFAVLSYLATHRGKLVSRDELLDAIWGKATVTNDALTQCIVEIRKAIDDDAHSIIRTVPRRGFIFDPPGTTPADSPGEPAVARQRSGRSRWAWIGGAAAVIAVIAIVSMRSTVDEVPVDENRADMSPYSIAVLPFADMSEAGDQQHVGDGIAEEILTRLTEYSDLVVIARTSSFRFRDRQDDVIEIGRSLNAAYVLEGSIRKSGSRLRITAQLIETQGGTHDWSQTFDRELTVENLLDIQAEVAASVAESIGAGPTRIVRRAADQNSPNAEAYDLYLEGMFYLQQIRTAEGEVVEEIYRTAIDRFQASIELDPDWATPHAALGRTMHFLAGTFQGHRHEEELTWLRLAKRHLEEAIRLDPEYALAYSSLGHVIFSLDFDFAAAEAAYERARALGNYFPWGYALFLAKAGRFEESIEEYKLAIARDPLTVGPRIQLATLYRCAGRPVDSIVELEKSLRMAPSRKDLYIQLASAYAETGNTGKGRAILEEHWTPDIQPLLYGPAYALLGMNDKAYEVLDQADPAERYWLEFSFGTLLVLGEEERALDYLEAAAKEDPRRLMHVLCLYGIESLSGNPRFEQLLRDAGFPDSAF